MKHLKQKLLLTALLLLAVVNVNAEVLTGSCGANLTYTLDTSTGVLQIEGSGSMDTWNGSPWDYARHTIKRVEMSYGVTTIGSYAFRDCSELAFISIPSSVTSIGYSAFDGCSNLTSIDIPSSVTSIDYNAFSYCYSLTSITIPSSVTNISAKAFYHCSGLSSIVVDADNPNYDSRNNCNAIINTSTNELIAGCMETVIPSSVTSIGNDAFSSCEGLTSISIPSSVTSIGERAFNWCYGLTSIDIPSSVTSIGVFAFNCCYALTSITIPSSVTSIGYSAFDGCSNLKDVTNFAETPQRIDNYTFYNVINATLYVPAGSIEVYKSTSPWSDFGEIKGIASVEYTVTATPNDATMGTVSGSGIYAEGSEVTLTATPNDGYEFVKWSDGKTDNPYTFVINEDVTITATFQKIDTSPISINNVTDLQNIKSGRNYVLDSDLVLTDSWKKIEDVENITLNGNGHTITTDFKNEGSVLFGKLSQSKVENLIVRQKGEGAELMMDGVFNEDRSLLGIGVIACLATSCTFSNIDIQHDIFGNANAIGGVVGVVDDCDFNKIKYSGSLYTPSRFLVDYCCIGGICGVGTFYTNNLIEECVISASFKNVRGTAYCVGGAVGLSSDNIRLHKIYANVDVEGVSDYAGGIIGYAVEAEMSQCVASGKVRGKGTFLYAGGIAGDIVTGGSIADSYSSVDIECSNEGYIGGIVGILNAGNVNRCYAKGNLTCGGYGVAGIGTAKSLNCVAACHQIILTEQTNYEPARISLHIRNSNCYALNTMKVFIGESEIETPDNNANGTSISQSELQKASFYAETLGWDMQNVWTIKAGNYPTLRWMTEEEPVMEYTVTGTPNEAMMGAVTGSGTYAEGSEVTLTATPNDGYEFVKWSDGTTANPYTFTATTDVTIIAVFQKKNEESGADTDISQYDNIIYFEKATAKAGEKIVLPLQLKNKMEVAAMMFDVEFPAGVTLDKNSRGKYDIRFNAEAERSDATIHSLSSALQPDGSIRVVVFSSSADVFYGNEGAIFDFPLTLSSDMEAGDHKIRIKNIELTQPNGVSVKLNEVISTLSIPDYVLGDVNGDDEIGMSDIMYIVNYLLGTPASTFDDRAADVNQDGEIGMSDIMYIVQYLLAGEFPHNNTASAKLMQNIMEQLKVRNNK